MNDDKPIISQNLPRDQSGRFLKGGSGRPVGTRNKISNSAMAEIKNMSGSAIAVLRMELARGNLDAAIWVLEKILPKNGRSVELDGVSAQDIAEAIVAGELSPSESRDLTSALKILRELHNTEQLEERLSRLESALSINVQKP